MHAPLGIHSRVFRQSDEKHRLASGTVKKAWCFEFADEMEWSMFGIITSMGLSEMPARSSDLSNSYKIDSQNSK